MIFNLKEQIVTAIRQQNAGLLSDIEDRWRDEDALRKAQAELREAQSEISNLKDKIRGMTPPTQRELDEIKESQETWKKIKDEKILSYNEGYSAAYIDVTNRMKSVNPDSQRDY